MERKIIPAWVKINEVCTVHVTDIYKWLAGRTGQFEIIPTDPDFPRNRKVLYECTLKTQTNTTEWNWADEQDEDEKYTP